MTNQVAPVTTTAAATASAPDEATIVVSKPIIVAPSAVPSSVVRFYYGDIAEQFLRNETPLIEEMAIAGFHALPFSSVLEFLISDKAIPDFVDKALSVIEGALHGKELDIDTHSNVVAAAINLVTKDMPSVALKFGPMLQGWIVARLVQLGITVKA